MPRTISDQDPKIPEPSFQELWQPVENFHDDIPILKSRGNRQLKMTFEQQLKSLILFHLEEYKSARHLLQVLEQDDFARSCIAPAKALARAVMVRLSTPGAWNNSSLSTRSFRLRPPPLYPRPIPNWGTCWPLTTPSSTPSVP